jgi:hypothetical protein
MATGFPACVVCKFCNVIQPATRFIARGPVLQPSIREVAGGPTRVLDRVPRLRRLQILQFYSACHKVHASGPVLQPSIREVAGGPARVLGSRKKSAGDDQRTTAHDG